MLASMIVILSGSLLYLFISAKARKDRFERQKLRLKYIQNQLLLSEMNPHFIFNVLSSIQNKILSDKPKDANKYIVKLAGLIRNYLRSSHLSNGLSDNPNNAEISLRDELELIESYLDFEQMQSNDHFNYRVEVDPYIDPTNTFIPPMLLQPFIENAVKHGLLLSDKKGELVINIDQIDASLMITIADDGVGIAYSKSYYQVITNKPSSIGLEIVKERISLLNALGYQINLSIEENIPVGTKIIVVIKEE
jgi:sensor histidine kinase YesM